MQASSVRTRKIGLLFVNHAAAGRAAASFLRAENQQSLVERHLDELIAQLGRFFLRLLIAHELDADHQALAANVADDLVSSRASRRFAGR